MRPSTVFSICLAAGLSVAAPIERRARSGTATFFAVGLGNCGWNSSPGDHIVAVSTDIYGSTSQKSGLCGQTVHITNTNTGKTATATIADSCPSCGGAGDLDMSTGLFNALGGTAEEGIFPITWTLGGESSNPKPAPKPAPKPSPKPAPKPSPSNSNSDNNRVANNDDNGSKPAAPTIPAAWAPFNNSTVNGFYYNATGFSNQTVSGLPAWWAEIDTASCNITAAANETYVAIAPSDNIRNATTLDNACGKLVRLTNVANNHTINATVSSWLPAAERNTVALASGYVALADIVDSMPSPIANVTWSFI